MRFCPNHALHPAPRAADERLSPTCRRSGWRSGLAVAWVLATYLPLVRLLRAGLAGCWRAAGGGGGRGDRLVSVVVLAQAHSTIEPHHAPAALIVEGPYKISRNPIYLGLLAILAGAVVWLGALSARGGAGRLRRDPDPALQSNPRRAALRRAFAPRRQAYLARTRRWL